ncbi:MAG: hypothetical protein ACRDGW_05575, partial [Actinomycetota bacterium]
PKSRNRAHAARRASMRTIIVGLVGGLMISACAGIGQRADISARGSTPAAGPASSAGPNTCPVTVPPQPGFVPPEPYPPEPGSGEVWYGTPALWTILDPDGEVWSDLPIGKGPHAVGDKTLWFSQNFSTAEGEDFSGDDDITLTAVRLDGPARTVVEKGGVSSFNTHIKNFLLVGLGLPKLGCWEITASYKGAELTYVLQVEE